MTGDNITFILTAVNVGCTLTTLVLTFAVDKMLRDVKEMKNSMKNTCKKINKRIRNI